MLLKLWFMKYYLTYHLLIWLYTLILFPLCHLTLMAEQSPEQDLMKRWVKLFINFRGCDCVIELWNLPWLQIILIAVSDNWPPDRNWKQRTDLSDSYARYGKRTGTTSWFVTLSLHISQIVKLVCWEINLFLNSSHVTHLSHTNLVKVI